MIENRENERVYLTGGVFDCLNDDGFTLIHSPDGLYEFLGYTREEISQLFHNHLLECIYIDDRQAVKEEISRQLAAGKVFMYENRLTTKDGMIRWVWVSAELGKDECQRQYFHCIFHDITDTKKNQEQLAISEQRYEIILSQTQDIIFELDCKTFEIYYSANFEKKFGYQIPVKGFPDSMFATDIIYEADKAKLRRKFQGLLSGDGHMSHEYRIKHKDGRYTWVDVHATVMRDSGGQPIKILGIITDIHARKTEILETKRMANLDPLTGLLNRRECVRRINRYVETCCCLAALIIVDIDNFKTLNDTKGHPYGDSVLTRISRGLLSVFRQNDVVARIGGDEFLIFLSEIKESDNILPKLEAIQEIFLAVNATGPDMPISCSIGVSFYPEHGSDFTTLFAKADAAMYHAKRHGKGQHCIYKEGKLLSRETVSKQPLSLQSDIQNHIIENIFRIFMEMPDNSTALPEILGFIGRTFRIDRIYICQKTECEAFKIKYHWCGREIPSMSDSLQTLFTLDFQRSPGFPAVDFRNTEEITNPAIRNWFKSRGVKAAFLFWVGDESRLMNIIGLEDCHEVREAIEEVLESLYMICEILNLFFIKEFNIKRIERRKNEPAATPPPIQP